MEQRRPRVLAAAAVVTAASVVAACGGGAAPTTTAPAAADSTLPDSTSSTTTTQPATRSTTTTTTVPPGGATTAPSTSVPDIPMLEDVPEIVALLLDEHYVCQLGFDGESDITASGTAAVRIFEDADGREISGEGTMDVTGVVRAGDVCSGEATGTHRFNVTGTVEGAADGTTSLTLLLTGTWYDTWDGKIVCNGGLPPSGPWEWPPEANVESLTFAPFEDGAAWAKDLTLGHCRGTITRVIDFTTPLPDPTSES